MRVPREKACEAQQGQEGCGSLLAGCPSSAAVLSYGKGRAPLTSSAISRRALLLLSQRDLYMVVSFSSFLIFLVIYKVGNEADRLAWATSFGAAGRRGPGLSRLGLQTLQTARGAAWSPPPPIPHTAANRHQNLTLLSAAETRPMPALDRHRRPFLKCRTQAWGPHPPPSPSSCPGLKQTFSISCLKVVKTSLLLERVF